MIHDSGPASPTIQLHNQWSQATDGSFSRDQRTLGKTLALWCNHSVNLLVLKTKGADAAMMRAAATDDVPLIRHLLSEYSVSANLHGGRKNQSVASKAAAHGNVSALATLLENGAEPNEVLTGKPYQPYFQCFNSGRLVRGHHATDKLTPETVKILLEHNNIDPNTVIQGMDSWHSIYLTPVELINSNLAIKDRDEICKLLVSHPQASVNRQTYFQRHAAFARFSKVDYDKLVDRNGVIHVNLIGQALMFDNFALAEHLLTDPELDPGLPRDGLAAENLLIIFMDRFSNRCFHGLCRSFDNFLASLRDKIVSSPAFFREIFLSQNLQTKQLFLALFAIEYQGRNSPSPTDFAHLDIDELDDQICDIFHSQPPSYEQLFAEPPPNYDSMITGRGL
ncbi:hypothetical protein [Endozoicomonas sp. YOMI1]|uniref:hypothetical protein n=1 Tax=Endozoicomonas sp. YOMI1 TaxID=2828739 RepID=UPI00214915E0|nr:hypothetical protein [Endozoicomonas sp. YOMI1]